jgi:DNA-directed RNA polymerase specialized sigma24 family protein
MNPVAASERATNKERIIAAFEAYQRQEPASVDNLMVVVGDFLHAKLKRLDHDFHDSAILAEDRAQNALMDIWSRVRLHQFTGTGEEFFRWVNRISFTARMEGLRELIDEQRKRTPLMFDGEAEDDPAFDNPALYEREVINESPFTIPNTVQGTDLSICRLILDGKSYAEIAAILDISEKAVKDRMYRIKRQMKAEGRTRSNPWGLRPESEVQ